MMHRRAADTPGHAELVGVIRDVRRRWRLRLWMRGMATLALAALPAILISALVLDRLAFSPTAVLASRMVLALLVLGLVVYLILLPVGRRVSDEQVALYLEEHEPSLRASLISALAAGSADAAVSPALARRTIETALQRCRAVENGRRIERRSLKLSSGMLGGAVVAGLLLFAAGPSFVKHGARAIFVPLRAVAAESAKPFRVLVAPGDTSLPRGADLAVSARLSGFRADQVELLVRVEGDSAFQRIGMLAHPDSGSFEVRLFDVNRPTEYYVEAGGVRSPVYRATVLEVPYVERLEVDLRFPAYTGLPPQSSAEGGDVAAPVGTLVRVRAAPTVPVAGGRIVLSNGRSVPLRADTAGTLVGEFRVAASELYHVELEPRTGKAVTGSPQYLVDAIEDRAPTVALSKPGRDTKVTSVDEVFVEARAEDDYGVGWLELVYSVNGGTERTVQLYDARPRQEVTAGHTLYLEELGLKPGDFVSYYARARDAGPGTRKPVVSDIYFLEIRPYGREYRQADTGGGGGGMGGGQQESPDGQLSRRQRELIAATFNVVRDRERSSEKEFRENVAALAEGQEKLRQQALTLAQRLVNRGAAEDSSFQIISQALPQAAAEMAQAVEQLRTGRPGDALPPEQRALLHLQRAEAAFREVQVSMGGDAMGGGGGGGPSAEDLADLFGLELNKLRNQYETVQRGERQQGQQQVSEVADRVRELARRLELENERLRQAMAGQQLPNGNGAASQRQLAAETEELARRLETLSREQSRPDLMDASRRLRDAAEQMRRAAADGRSGNAGATRAAMDRLEEASRRLQRNQASGAQEEARDLARRAQQLAEEQRRIGEEMRAGGANQPAQARRLLERKDQQAAEVADLERQLDRLAGETRGEQPNASRRLGAAAESIRRNQLKENIRASRAATQPGASQEYARRMEEEIASGLEELRELTEQASRAVAQGASTGRRADESLERARDLVRGLESMQERTRRAQENAANRNSRPAQGAQERQRGSRQDGPQQDQGPQQGRQQGQSGQGGEQGGPEGGQQPGATRQGGGFNSPGTGWSGGGPAPGSPSAEAVRQLRGEIRERLQEAQALRRELARQGRDVRELDRAIAEMRAMDAGRVYADWEELRKLQSAAADRLREFEFTLRQQLGGEEARRLFLSGSGDVPAQYRELVERYYRELSDRAKQ